MQRTSFKIMLKLNYYTKLLEIKAFHFEISRDNTKPESLNWCSKVTEMIHINAFTIVLNIYILITVFKQMKKKDSRKRHQPCLCSNDETLQTH